MIPAFSAWIESPEPGISASTTVSAIESTPTSLWPVPTVSRKTMSLPAASRISSACRVVSASPPRCPRVPIERMKTSGSRKWSVSRIRSPSSAPWVNGLDGSTEITPTVCCLGAHEPDQRGRQARLADAGRPGQPDGERVARLRIDVADDLVRERIAVLDERDRTRERTPVARQHRLDETLARPVAPLAHAGMLRSQLAGQDSPRPDTPREQERRQAAARDEHTGDGEGPPRRRRRRSARRRRSSRARAARCAR